MACDGGIVPYRSMRCVSRLRTGPILEGDHTPSPCHRRLQNRLLFRHSVQIRIALASFKVHRDVAGMCDRSRDLPCPPRRVEGFWWCIGIESAIFRAVNIWQATDSAREELNGWMQLCCGVGMLTRAL